MCHHIFMYDRRDQNNNSQTNASIKYILNNRRAMQNEIKWNLLQLDNDKYIRILEYVLEYLI